MIENKCSKCGWNIMFTVLTYYPPIHKWECGKCWVVKTEQTEIEEQIIDMK